MRPKNSSRLSLIRPSMGRPRGHRAGEKASLPTCYAADVIRQIRGWGVLFGIALLATPTLAADRPSTADGPFELFALAREYAASGDAAESERLWQQGLLRFPDEPYARLEYADQLRRWGRLSDAAKQYEAALQLAPENRDVLWQAGVFYRRHPDARPEALERSKEILTLLVDAVPDDYQAWLELGVIALSQAKFDSAADHFRRARDIAPFSLTASGYLAEALMRGGQSAAAEEALRDLLSKDPTQLRARLALARLSAERDEVNEAIALLRGAPGEQASDPNVNRRLAFLLARTDDSKEAKILATELLAENPNDRELRRLAVRLEARTGGYDGAADLMRPYVADTPEDVDAALELVEYLEVLGRSEEAVEILNHSISALAENSEGRRRARLRRLDLLGRMEEWGAVLQATEPLVDDPRDANWTVFPLHAEALFHQRGLKAARRWLQRMVEREPRLAPAALAKELELLLVAEHARDADEVLQQLLELEGPLGPSLAAQVYSLRDQSAEAVELLGESLQRAPDRIDLRFQMAAALDEVDRWPEAEEVLLGILESQADHAASLNYLAYTWAEQGRNLDRALSMVQTALEQDPDNGAYLDTLGWIYFKLERYQEARPLLERAAAMVPGDAVILEHLGDLYRALGEPARARTFYDWAMRIGGDDATVGAKIEQLAEDG